MPYCGLGYGPYFCAAADGHVGLCAHYSPACLDLANDPDNCGGVAISCPAGQTCVHGLCGGVASSECGLGKWGSFCNLDAGTTFACCPSAGCTNIFTDDANCGGCWAACPSGQHCTGGVCG